MPKKVTQAEENTSNTCWVLSAICDGLKVPQEEYKETANEIHDLFNSAEVSKLMVYLVGAIYSSLKTDERIKRIIATVEKSDSGLAGYFGKKALNGFQALLEFSERQREPLYSNNKIAPIIANSRTSIVGRPMQAFKLTIEQRIVRRLFYSRLCEMKI